MLKVLVTGAGGQVATSLVNAANVSNIDLVALSRAILDITDSNSVMAAMRAHRPDVVVNAAAYTAVDKAESEPDAARRVNETGAANIANACRLTGVPVIHISTDYVFDGTKTSPYVEEDVAAPLNAYGCSKLAGEVAVADKCPAHIILRTSWVYSPFGHNFVRTMLRLAETRDELSVVDDQVGSPTFAPHLAEAILLIAERGLRDATLDAPWGVYNVAGDGETTWCGLARAVFDQARGSGGPTARVRAISTADYPTPAHRPVNSRLSCDKLERTFGIVLPHWMVGVADCVAQIKGDKHAHAEAKGGK